MQASRLQNSANTEDDVVVEKNDELKTKLQAHIASTGSLSESDVASFMPAAGDGQSQPEERLGKSMEESTTLPANDPGEHDGMDAAAGSADAQDGLRSIISGMQPSSTPLAQAKKRVLISPVDKEAFVQALVSGDRMRLKFSLCGGAVKIIVRNRTMSETQAIIAQLRHEMDNGTISTNLDYSVRLRAMLMTAQVDELNGVVHPTMESCVPLRRTQGKDGIEEPGWLEHSARWAGLNEGFHAVIWGCVWDFETKYWAMVEDAKNQDFWLPEASTSE